MRDHRIWAGNASRGVVKYPYLGFKWPKCPDSPKKRTKFLDPFPTRFMVPKLKNTLKTAFLDVYIGWEWIYGFCQKIDYGFKLPKVVTFTKKKNGAQYGVLIWKFRPEIQPKSPKSTKIDQNLTFTRRQEGLGGTLPMDMGVQGVPMDHPNTLEFDL